MRVKMMGDLGEKVSLCEYSQTAHNASTLGGTQPHELAVRCNRNCTQLIMQLNCCLTVHPFWHAVASQRARRQPLVRSLAPQSDQVKFSRATVLLSVVAEGAEYATFAT